MSVCMVFALPLGAELAGLGYINSKIVQALLALFLAEMGEK